MGCDGMKRYEDWPVRLLAVVNAAEKKPFAWGEHDCALMAADCVLAETGFDFAKDFRGRYTTALGALKALRSNGATDLVDYVTQVLGDPVVPTLAQRGDVVMFETAEGHGALGVVVGLEAAAAGPEGVTWVPLALWKKAWRV